MSEKDQRYTPVAHKADSVIKIFILKLMEIMAKGEKPNKILIEFIKHGRLDTDIHKGLSGDHEVSEYGVKCSVMGNDFTIAYMLCMIVQRHPGMGNALLCFLGKKKFCELDINDYGEGSQSILKFLCMLESTDTLGSNAQGVVLGMLLKQLDGLVSDDDQTVEQEDHDIGGWMARMFNDE